MEWHDTNIREFKWTAMLPAQQRASKTKKFVMQDKKCK